jgi:flagellar protein FlaG
VKIDAAANNGLGASPAPSRVPPTRGEAPASPGAEAADAAVPDPIDVRRASEAANRQLREKGSELAFELDDESGRVVAKLVDRQTGEVIRQVPSKEVLSIARALAQGAAAGSMVRTAA